MAGTLPPIVGVLRLETSNFSKGIKTSISDLGKADAAGTSAFARMGGGAERALGAMSKASLVAGIGAVKLASDYDDSLTHIQGLVGASQEQTDAWSKQMLDLAPKVGKAPKELAEALYFVTSSGVDAAEAMDVVTVSAKASASGLGETQVVADAVTSAMAAYGPEVMSAAKATDVLVATVREGKGEPEQLAGALGRVIAPAQAMGVTFGEVGGAVAAMSLIMPDVNEDVTGLRNLLTAISAPGDKAAATLHAYGLSMEEVRSTIREKGLLAGLELVTTATHGNQEALHAIFPDIRGFNALQILTGANLAKNREIIDRVTNSTGALNSAWAKAGESDSVKFRKGLASVEAAGIRLGNALMPAATGIATAVGHIATAFSHLPEGAQVAVLGVGLLAGPLLKVSKGALEARAAWAAYRAEKFAQVGVDAALSTAEEGLAAKTAASGAAAATAGAGAGGLARSAGGLVGALVPVGVVLGGLVGLFGVAQRSIKDNTSVVGEFGKMLSGTTEATKQETAATAAQAATQGVLQKQLGTTVTAQQKASLAHKQAAAALEQEAARVRGMIPAFEGYKRNSDITADRIKKNLIEERNAFSTWAADTRTLIRRGADPELVRALSEKGPAYVHAFAHASDRQLADLRRIFGQRTRAATDVAKAEAARGGAQAGSAAARAMEQSFHPILRAPVIPAPRGGGRLVQYAQGGILHEPVMGIGLRSGTTYTLAEAGPEAVVPLSGRRGGRRGGLGGGGGLTVNGGIHVYGVPDPERTALMVRDELLKFAGRNLDIFGGNA